MNIENILNNDDNKLIFLRAILLGINYGKTNKSDYYLQVVENEIGNIVNKKNLSKNNIKNHIIDKNESVILQLENQRNNTLTLIWVRIDALAVFRQRIMNAALPVRIFEKGGIQQSAQS